MSTTETTNDGRIRRWLNPTALVFVALAAVMGWGASFVGLHAYALEQMTGFNFWTGWLVPATFDGAAFGCTLITYRASISGRPAMRGRILMWAFTAISSWINWTHQTSPDARTVAAGLPLAAVGVFEIVLIELRADHEARHGRHAIRIRPGLLLVRWLADRTGTTATLRTQITNIPVTDLAGLPNTPAPTSVPEPVAEPAAPAETGRTAARKGPRLPAATLDKLRTARDEAHRQGRTLQPDDVQAVVKVPDPMAADLAAEFAANGQPVT